MRAYYLKNKERWRTLYAHPEQKRESDRRYRERNKSVLLLKKLVYVEHNSDLVAQRKHAWYMRNRERILARSRSEAGRAKNRSKTTNRGSTPSGKVEQRLRSRIHKAVHRQGTQKSSSTWELVGCNRESLLAHLVSQFTEGMTIEAVMDGLIEIDHVRPCASFDLADPEQQKACFHYTNLQPLWMTDNRRKHAKWKPHASAATTTTAL